MLEIWLSRNGQQIGAGPIVTSTKASIVMEEVNQFSDSSIDVAGSDRRAIETLQAFTEVEVVQPGVGTILHGWIINPQETIDQNDAHTITVPISPLPVEMTWDSLLPGFVAVNNASVIAERVGSWTQIPYPWTADYQDADDPLTQLTADDNTPLSGLIQLAQQQNKYVRLGKNPDGSPARVIEFGTFGAAPTVWLSSADGADADDLDSNLLTRLVATIQRQPSDGTKLLNVSAPAGGGNSKDTLVTLEACWRILFDPTYPNYVGLPGNSIALLFPEYDPVNYPFGDPAHDPDGSQHGAVPLYDGRRAYTIYDKASYDTYKYKRGPYVDKGVNYPDSTPGRVEITSRALYVSMCSYFKRYSHPHHVFSCTTDAATYPTRGGDLIAVDVQRISEDQTGAVVEMDVQDTLRVMQIVRQFNGDVPPVDQYTLSNLGRFEDDDTTYQAATQKQIATVQINTGTTLDSWLIGPVTDNVDTGHALEVPISIPPTVFRFQAASLRIDFQPYRASAKTALSKAYPFKIKVPTLNVTITTKHGDHTIASSDPTKPYDATNKAFKGATSGFDLSQTGAEQDAVITLGIDHYGGPYDLANALYVVTVDNQKHLGAQGPIVGNGATVPVKINFTKSQTASDASIPLAQLVGVASNLTGTVDQSELDADLPPHDHDLDQQIPDGPLPISIGLSFTTTSGTAGQALSSGVTLLRGTRRADGAFTASSEVQDMSSYLNPFIGKTLILRLESLDYSTANPFGVGRIVISGTWVFEIGGLTSTVQAN